MWFQPKKKQIFRFESWGILFYKSVHFQAALPQAHQLFVGHNFGHSNHFMKESKR